MYTNCNSGDVTPTYDTIVMGVGAAGAAASATLAAAGHRVLALEAQAYIGGRVRTVSFGDGIIEMGAEWIHGEKSSPIYDLVTKHNVPVKLQNRTMAVFCSDGSPGDHDLINDLMAYSYDVLHEDPTKYEPLGVFLGRKIMDYLKDNKPYVLKDKEYLDEVLQLISLMYNDYEGTSDWNDISADTQYRELEGEQDWSWHRLGYSTLFDILLNKFNNGPGLPNLDIKLNTEVINLTWPQDPSEKVTVTCKNGEIYTAGNVIVTVSIGVLKERHEALFSPSLPKEKVDTVNIIPMGVIDKIVLSFSDPWWPRNQSSYAFLWRKEDKKNVAKQHNWITKIFGATCSMGSDNVLILWTNGNTARLVETLPEETVKSQSMGLLQRFMGSGFAVPEPVAIIRTDWYSNPFTRGSFTYDSVPLVRQPLTRTVLAQPLRDAAGTPRVLFAGEATHETRFSTVHGAADTGYREAQRILAHTT